MVGEYDLSGDFPKIIDFISNFSVFLVNLRSEEKYF